MHEHDMTRRQAVKHTLVGLVSGLVPLLLGQKKAEAKYGRCASCSCPGFSGSGNTCSRCGHHYDAHW